MDGRFLLHKAGLALCKRKRPSNGLALSKIILWEITVTTGELPAVPDSPVQA